eukprot:359768-Chlamydomonas_euryale.AAC.3
MAPDGAVANLQHALHVCKRSARRFGARPARLLLQGQHFQRQQQVQVGRRRCNRRNLQQAARRSGRVRTRGLSDTASNITPTAAGVAAAAAAFTATDPAAVAVAYAATGAAAVPEIRRPAHLTTGAMHAEQLKSRRLRCSGRTKTDG